MIKYKLTGEPRTIVGKKTKQLRKKGVIPATIYGKQIKSETISVTADELNKIYKEAGVTGLIELTITGEKRSSEAGSGSARPVLIQQLQIHPVTSALLHVEFHQVDLKEKVHAKVPLEFTGISPAIKEKLGLLLTVMNDLEVEALPADLPEHISVDISNLKAINDHILVKNLIVPKDVIVLTDGELMVVKIGELIAPEPEPTPTVTVPVSAEAPAEGTATPTAEGAEKTEKKEAPKEPEAKK